MVFAVTVTVRAGPFSASAVPLVSPWMLTASPRSELSSSVMVSSVPFTVRFVAVPSTDSFSSPSMTVSCVGVRVNVPVPLSSPAEMVTSKSATAV